MATAHSCVRADCELRGPQLQLDPRLLAAPAASTSELQRIQTKAQRGSLQKATAQVSRRTQKSTKQPDKLSANDERRTNSLKRVQRDLPGLESSDIHSQHPRTLLGSQRTSAAASHALLGGHRGASSLSHRPASRAQTQFHEQQTGDFLFFSFATPQSPRTEIGWLRAGEVTLISS